MLRSSILIIIAAVMLSLTSCATTQRPAPAPAVSIKAGRSVSVQQGETLYSFARRNNASMREIIDLNRLQAPYVLSSGQLLKLPATDADLPSVELGPIAAENEIEYKQKHKGKPVTTYTQVAAPPITDAQAQDLNNNPYAPRLSAPKSELQNAADDQFNPPAGQDVKAATTALNLKPMKFDEDSKQLAEHTKPTGPVSVTVPDKTLPDKTVPQKNTLQKPAAKPIEPSKMTKAGKLIKDKPDPNDVDVRQIKPEQPIPPQLKPTVEAKKPAQKGDEAKPTEREMHSRIENKAEPRNLSWPVQGTVISTYGPKSNGLKNDGINIAVPRGTPVLAADGGTVAYAGSDIPGYGNVVLVRHPNGLMTTYAHLDRMFVQENIVVAKGDLLGTVGTSGGIDTPQLHFEIRRDKEALDPGKYLYR